MQENLQQIQTHIRMVWRYRWVALVSATVICLIGWTGVMLLPNKYQVTTKVFLDTRSMLRPVLRGLAVDNRIREDSIRMMRRTLLSRPNLESVARSTDMDLAVNTPEQFESLLKGLSSKVKILGTIKDNIFVLSYTNRDPKLATRVVEALLNIFVERSLGESRKDSSKTREFIDQQIREYETRLEQAEARLKEFKQRNVGLMPSEGKNYYGRREEVAAQLAEAKLRLKEATNRRDELRRQLGGEEPTFGLGPALPGQGRTGGPFDARLQKLQEQLDSLQLQYTDRHPDVVALRRLIDSIQKQNAKAMASQSSAEAPSATSPGLTENPVYQEMKIALGNAEAEVAALKARVDEYKKREVELKRLVDTVPKVEAELKALNRDYEVNRRNYDELVKRRESLKISDEAGKSTDEIQFNIIEPPRVPLLPAAPDRPKLSAAVLVLGLGAGVGLAWLIAMIRPAFYSKEDFSDFTDLPLLGAVSRISTSQEMFRRRVGYVLFVAGLMGLLSLFAGLLALQSMHIDFGAKLAKLGASL